MKIHCDRSDKNAVEAIAIAASAPVGATAGRARDAQLSCDRVHLRLKPSKGGSTMRCYKLALLMIALSGAAHAGENLLSDGNFGTGPVPPWIPVPLTLSYSVISSDGKPASPAVEMTTSGSGSSGQGLYQCVATTAGAVYRASAYVKRTSASTTTITTIGLAAAFYTGAGCTGAILGLANATTDPDTLAVNAWTKLDSGPVTAPVTTQSALVGLGADGADTAVYTFRADSAFLGLDDVIFFDGFEVD